MSEQRCQLCKWWASYKEGLQGRCDIPLSEAWLKHVEGITVHTYHYQGMGCSTFEPKP